jgi:hypothetical protein
MPHPGDFGLLAVTHGRNVDTLRLVKMVRIELSQKT